MSDEKKQHDELEELSLLLDELNAGRRPECADPETAELLAVADLIKKSSGPVCPPRHILDQTVDRALAGIRAGHQKPARAWWYSGALGTAAAVMLVFGLNMLPSWQQQVPLLPPTTVSQPPAATQPKPDNGQTTPVPPVVPAEITTPETSSPATSPPPATAPQIKAPPVAVAPVQPSKPPAAVIEKSIIAEEAPRVSKSKSAYLPPTSFHESSQSPAAPVAPLKIPGQKPDLVVIERDKGTIRQVYYKGTPQEITINQRPRPKDCDDAQIKTHPLNALQNPEHDSDINTVQVTIGDQDVTLLGRLSRQELLKIAESLAP